MESRPAGHPPCCPRVMSRRARILPHPLGLDEKVKDRCLTIIRDFTDAQDSAALLFNMTKDAFAPNPRNATPSSSPIVFLSTRSRTQVLLSDAKHVYPVQSRTATSMLAGYIRIDPYKILSQEGMTSEAAYSTLLAKILEASRANRVDMVVIECSYSLKYVFGVDPVAFIHALLGGDGPLSVLVACPAGFGDADDLDELADLADGVVDLRDLQTGVAEDMDGLIEVAKEHGRWAADVKSYRYHAVDSSFEIFS